MSGDFNTLLVHIAPVNLLGLSQQILVGLSGNPNDIWNYCYRFSPTGQEPATHIAASSAATDDFAERAVMLHADPQALVVATGGAVDLVTATGYCENTVLLVNEGTVEQVAGLDGLIQIIDYEREE